MNDASGIELRLAEHREVVLWPRCLTGLVVDSLVYGEATRLTWRHPPPFAPKSAGRALPRRGDKGFGMDASSSNGSATARALRWLHILPYLVLVGVGVDSVFYIPLRPYVFYGLLLLLTAELAVIIVRGSRVQV